MERKMNVADFATLVGTTSKTIYQKIQNNGDLPLNEQLITVKEKIKGRETTLIVTNSEQINYYRNLYGNYTVNDSEYYETLTDNNGDKQVTNSKESSFTVETLNSMEILTDKILTVNDDFINRLEQKNTELLKVYNELSTVKQRQLLLEDKAGREGLYLNEINGLKKDNNRLMKVIYTLITVLMIVLFGVTGYITYNITVNNLNKPVINQINTTPEVITQPADTKKEVKPVKAQPRRK